MRPRIYRGADIALGPGKAELLAAVAATGSIREAARRLDMSYMRAWTLIRTMNRCFAAPVVEAVRGGEQGGSARLTAEGRAVLALYRRMAMLAERAVRPEWRAIRNRLRSGLVLLFGLLASRAAADDVVMFAAASLTEALRENAATFQRAGGDSVVFAFGASSTLALQIQAGAPADVFFSADEAKMDGLEKARLLAAGTRRNVLSNQLVVAVDADLPVAIAAPHDLLRPEVRHLALGEPRTVPAGIYARQWLEGLGLWTRLTDRVVPAENVRAALAAVEAGNAEAAIVYATDVRIAKHVRVAYVVPRDAGPRIVYPVAVLAEARHPEAARRFVDFLATEAALAVFAKHGFTNLASSPQH